MPLPHGTGRGDMYILYEVDLPDDEWLRGIDQEVCGLDRCFWFSLISEYAGIESNSSSQKA